MSLEALASLHYPGRGIILGCSPDGSSSVAIYFITGRSPSSQARKLVLDSSAEQQTIRTCVTDPEQLKTGDSTLLLYPAVTVTPEHILLSNGAHTNLLYGALRKIQTQFKSTSITPGDVLARAFTNAAYTYTEKHGYIDITSVEPDPLSTPRIAGCINKTSAGFWIARKLTWLEQSTIRPSSLFAYPLVSGQAHFLSTYNGPLEGNPRSFEGSPRTIHFETTTAQEACQAVWDTLDPSLRVSVAAVYLPHTPGQPEIALLNKTP